MIEFVERHEHNSSDFVRMNVESMKQMTIKQ
jgi:hypothetical protein